MTYKCMSCGKTALIKAHQDEVFSYCFNCNFRTNHKLVDKQRVSDFKCFKDEFQDMIEEFREITKLANYQLSKLHQIEEFVLQAQMIEKRLDDQYTKLMQSLNTISYKEVQNGFKS